MFKINKNEQHDIHFTSQMKAHCLNMIIKSYVYKDMEIYSEQRFLLQQFPVEFYVAKKYVHSYAICSEHKGKQIYISLQIEQNMIELKIFP